MKKVVILSCLLMFSSLNAHPKGEHDGGHHNHEHMMKKNDVLTPNKTVHIDAVDAGGKMRFKPDSIQVKKGDVIKFIIKNKGVMPHEFVIGEISELQKHAEEMKKNPHMKHDEPNQVSLAVGETKELIWKFKKSGTIDFACLLPGHYELGMHGKVDVKD